MPEISPFILLSWVYHQLILVIGINHLFSMFVSQNFLKYILIKKSGYLVYIKTCVKCANLCWNTHIYILLAHRRIGHCCILTLATNQSTFGILQKLHIHQLFAFVECFACSTKHAMYRVISQSSRARSDSSTAECVLILSKFYLYRIELRKIRL